MQNILPTKKAFHSVNNKFELYNKIKRSLLE